MCVCCSLAAAAEADGLALLAALQAGTDKITFYGGAEEGMRTLLVRPIGCCRGYLWPLRIQTSGVCQDAMIPAHRGGGAVAKAGTPAAAVVGAMAAAAMEGAEATRTMSAVAGRASYVPDSQVQGTPDPGAMAVALVLQAVARSCE